MKKDYYEVRKKAKSKCDEFIHQLQNCAMNNTLTDLSSIPLLDGLCSDCPVSSCARKTKIAHLRLKLAALILSLCLLAYLVFPLLC